MNGPSSSGLESPPLTESFAEGARWARRLIVRRPVLVSMLCLAWALGIGVNGALLGVFRSVFLEPLPFPSPERLVRLWEVDQNRPKARLTVAPANLLDWRTQCRAFDQLAAFSSWRPIASFGDADVVLGGANLEPRLIEMLGGRAILGRTFSHEPQAGKAVLLSYDAWRRRWSGNADVVGKTIRLNGEPHTIVGVMEPSFRFPYPLALEAPEVWGLLHLDPATASRKGRSVSVVGRLAPNVSVTEARSQIAEVARRLSATFPVTNARSGVHLSPFREVITEQVRKPLGYVALATLFVFLIACANATALILALGVRRLPDFETQAMLGAPATRLLQQIIAESVALSLLGAAAGLGLAQALLVITRRLGTSALALPRLAEIRVDGWVVVLMLGFAALTAFGATAVTAGQVFWKQLQGRLRVTRSSITASLGTQRVLRALLIGQVAVAAVLVVAAATMLRHAYRARAVAALVGAERVLTLEVALPRSAGYRESSEARALFARGLQESLRAIPGVQAAGFGLPLPPASPHVCPYGTERDGQEMPGSTHLRFITPGTLSALGLRLLSGRDLTDQDFFGGELVVIINDAMRRQLGGGTEALDSKLRFGLLPGRRYRVVGIVGNDAAYGPVDRPEAYCAFFQLPSDVMHVAVRASNDPSGLAGVVRAAAKSLEPNAHVSPPSTLARQLFDEKLRQRALTLFLTLGAGVGLLLATIGVWGVTTFVMGTRRREIAIRVAMGAAPRNILALLAGDALKVTGAAAVLVLLAAALGQRFAGDATEWHPDFLFVAIVFLGIALVAIAAHVLGGWSACKVDPAAVLRAD